MPARRLSAAMPAVSRRKARGALPRGYARIRWRTCGLRASPRVWDAAGRDTKPLPRASLSLTLARRRGARSVSKPIRGTRRGCGGRRCRRRLCRVPAEAGESYRAPDQDNDAAVPSCAARTAGSRGRGARARAATTATGPDPAYAAGRSGNRRTAAAATTALTAIRGRAGRTVRRCAASRRAATGSRGAAAAVRAGLVRAASTANRAHVHGRHAAAAAASRAAVSARAAILARAAPAGSAAAGAAPLGRVPGVGARSARR
jgi:hypothetical protein